MNADLVIRNGMVVDGAGGAPRRCDVAIEGDQIVAVGGDIARGHREFDADGHMVTPGFIDPHTHYDLSLIHILWRPFERGRPPE